MRKKRKKQFFKFVKIVITVLLLYLVFNKIPFPDILQGIKLADKKPLLVGLLLFFMSQLISARRLLVLFRALGFYISRTSNNKLYLLGMFYNFFIPGGVGGDAYKVYLLNKEFNWSIKKLSTSVFLDRFMGLTAIMIIILILINFIKVQFVIPISGIILLILLTVGGAYLIVKKWFSYFIPVFNKVLMLSIIVQLLQCFCVLSLLVALSDENQIEIYLLIFLVSSMLSVFSFAGIGVREFVFYKGAYLLGFDSTMAVTISLLFSGLTAFVSLFGIIFHLKQPKLHIEKAI